MKIQNFTDINQIKDNDKFIIDLDHLIECLKMYTTRLDHFIVILKKDNTYYIYNSSEVMNFIEDTSGDFSGVLKPAYSSYEQIAII